MANELLVGTGTGAASGALMGAPLGPWGALVGGLIGAGAGALGGMGQKKANKNAKNALKQQQAVIQGEIHARNQDVGAVRAKFGDVGGLKTAPTTGQSAVQTLQNHGDLAGGIEGQATATRDAGLQQLTGAGQQAAASQRGISLSRGLMGSSLDESARQVLLSQYAGGRSDVATATEGVRDAGWQGVQRQQLGLEDKALGGQRMGGILEAMRQDSQIAGARAQMPYTEFGNLLSTGLGLARAGAVAGEEGSSGGKAFIPGGLPSKSSATQGGTVSRARV